MFTNFVGFRSASGLALTFRKTVSVPLWDVDSGTLAAFLDTLEPAASGISIRLYVKYLGILLGPEAHLHQWRAQWRAQSSPGRGVLGACTWV